MSGPILHKSAAILLVGAGPTSREVITKGFALTDSIVAVDGGLAAIQDAGVMPDLIVGDFDSVQSPPKDVAMVHLEDQNYTDLDKALGALDADVFIGAGFLGGRVDHQLAAFSSLINDPRPVVLIDETQLVFHCPPHLCLDLPAGCHIALYPLASVRVDAIGLTYNIVDAAMSPTGLISTSNSAIGGKVDVHRMGNGLLVTLPIGELAQVVDVLG